MEYVYYANGKRVEIREYLEVMLASKGEYKQDVVLINGGTVHVLVAEVQKPIGHAEACIGAI